MSNNEGRASRDDRFLHLENGHADVQLSTLFRIFEGLGKRISFTIK